MHKIALALVVITIFFNLAFAQDALTARVDEFVNTEMQRQKIPGVGLAVVREGKPYIIKGYGLANVEHQVKVKPETIFQSGSVGKQFTSMAVMLLVEDGKIKLDEKISAYLGEVPEAWRGITVRHLLSHTSGMTDYPRDFDFRRDYTEDELLTRAKEVPLAFQPGEKWQYSNLGYVTLGILIHKVSSKFYGDLLQERVFKPLGMTTAKIISEADIVPNRAAGYALVNGELKNQRWVSPSLNTTADGALYLTLYDMIKWDDALRTGKLLKNGSLEQLWTPVKLNDGRTQSYGFGWSIASRNSRRVIEHGGAWQGFKSQISRFVDDDLTIIVFANLAQANPVTIVNGVAAMLDEDLVIKPINDPDPKFSASVKELLIQFIDGKTDESRLTPEVQRSLAGAQQRISAIVKPLGPIQSFELMDRSVTPEATRLRYRVKYASMTVALNVAINKDGKFSGFTLNPE